SRLQAELPPDKTKLRQEFVGLEEEQQLLEKNLASRRSEFQEAEKQLEEQARERDQTHRQLTEAQGQLSLQETNRHNTLQSLERVQKELSASWRAASEKLGLAALAGWTQELADLEARKTEERVQQLQEARVASEMFQRDLEALEKQQEGFLVEARQDPVA